jgi:hypothetical protein
VKERVPGVAAKRELGGAVAAAMRDLGEPPSLGSRGPPHARAWGAATAGIRGARRRRRCGEGAAAAGIGCRAEEAGRCGSGGAAG